MARSVCRYTGPMWAGRYIFSLSKPKQCPTPGEAESYWNQNWSEIFWLIHEYVRVSIYIENNWRSFCLTMPYTNFGAFLFCFILPHLILSSSGWRYLGSAGGSSVWQRYWCPVCWRRRELQIFRLEPGGPVGHDSVDSGVGFLYLWTHEILWLSES